MRNLCSFAFTLLAVVLLAHAVAAEPLLWKSVTNSFLRVNDSAVKEWSVFQIEEDDPRYLIQLAERFLLVDSQSKQVFDLAPAGIEPSGSGVLWDPADRPSRPLVTSEWLVRDVGFAYRIKMRLDAEDRTLDLQLSYVSMRP
jgi:hypothetical protein